MTRDERVVFLFLVDDNKMEGFSTIDGFVNGNTSLLISHLGFLGLSLQFIRAHKNKYVNIVSIKNSSLIDGF